MNPVDPNYPLHLYLIDNHIYYPYTSGFSDTWDMLETADEDPLDSGNIVTVYKNESYAKQGGGNNFYNREHTWPKSFGFPDDDFNAYPYTDAHHLMLADSIYNSSRSNLAYGTCSLGCSEAPSTEHNGQGGGSGVYPGNSNWYSGSGGTSSFEVWRDRRGDAARAQFYMDLRYEGGSHEVSGSDEPDLVLTDDTSLILTFSDNTNGIAYMGRLAVLLDWHELDPVDDLERQRNEVIYRFQGNRNPFVDHPEWAACIFEGTCGNLTPCILEQFSVWTQSTSTCSGSGTVSILDLVAMLNGDCDCP